MERICAVRQFTDLPVMRDRAEIRTLQISRFCHGFAVRTLSGQSQRFQRSSLLQPDCQITVRIGDRLRREICAENLRTCRVHLNRLGLCCFRTAFCDGGDRIYIVCINRQTGIQKRCILSLFDHILTAVYSITDNRLIGERHIPFQ